MKKFYSLFITAVAILSVVSCAQEIANPDEEIIDVPVQEEVITSEVVKFVAGTAETKTSLDPENKLLLWSADDQISVNGTTFSIEDDEISDDKKTATFSSSDEFDDNDGKYLAVYPAGEYTYDYENFKVQGIVVSATPKVVAGTFAEETAPEIAYSETNALTFSSICTYLKFTVACDGVTKVTISSNNSEPLAGTVDVTWNEGAPTYTVQEETGSETVTLTAEFAKGSTYYVPVLPANLAGGLTVKFNDIEVKNRTTAIQLTRNAIGNLGELTMGDWVMIGEVGTIHMYKSTKYTELYVASSVTLNDSKSFLFKSKNGKTVGAHGTAGNTVDCKEQINSWYNSDITDAYKANIKVSSEDSYDIYFSPENNDFLIVESGNEEEDTLWEVVGWINSKDSWAGNSGHVLKQNYVYGYVYVDMNLTSSDYFKFLKNKNWTAGDNGGWIGAPGNDGGTKDYNVTNEVTINTYHSYDNHKAQFHLMSNGRYRIIVNVNEKAYTSATVKIIKIG